MKSISQVAAVLVVVAVLVVSGPQTGDSDSWIGGIPDCDKTTIAQKPCDKIKGGTKCTKAFNEAQVKAGDNKDIYVTKTGKACKAGAAGSGDEHCKEADSVVEWTSSILGGCRLIIANPAD